MQENSPEKMRYWCSPKYTSKVQPFGSDSRHNIACWNWHFQPCSRCILWYKTAKLFSALMQQICFPSYSILWLFSFKFVTCQWFSFDLQAPLHKGSAAATICWEEWLPHSWQLKVIPQLPSAATYNSHFQEGLKRQSKSSLLEAQLPRWWSKTTFTSFRLYSKGPQQKNPSSLELGRLYQLKKACSTGTS